MQIVLASILFLFAGSALAMASLPSTGIPAPRPSLGGVSVNNFVQFENVKELTPALKEAVNLLRAEQFKAAEAAFQRIQRLQPWEELAYEGEIEASDRLGTLHTTVARYRGLLSHTEASHKRNNNGFLAVLHWALGQAIMMHNGYYPKFIGDNPNPLGPEPEQQFQTALKLDPKLLVAYLSLGAYYEHHSVEKGSLARQQYKQALHIRPDLYQIRYVHAFSWDRPGIISPEEEARESASGFPPSEDSKRMPQKAMMEYRKLIQDHPNYAPPYYCMADDLWLMGDKTQAKEYYTRFLQLGRPNTDSWKRAKEIVDAMNK